MKYYVGRFEVLTEFGRSVRKIDGSVFYGYDTSVPVNKWFIRWQKRNYSKNPPGSVLVKKSTGGLGLFFGSEIFDILIFGGLEKSLLFFWV